MKNKQLDYSSLDKLNDKQEKGAIKSISKIYDLALKRIRDLTNSLYSKYSDSNGQLTQLELAKYDRLQKYNKEIKTILSELNISTQGEIIDFIKLAYNENYLGIGYALENNLGVSIGYVKPNPIMVQELIVDAPVGGLTIKQRLKINSNTLYNRTVGSLAQSVALGEGQRKAVKRLGLVLEKDANSLATTVRTERKRVSSKAQLDSMKRAEDKGLKLKKVWVASLDGRTRGSHRKLDGQSVPIDGEFHIRGHKAKAPGLFGVPDEDINCRCTMITTVDEVSIEDMQRRGKGREVGKYKTYEEWYKSTVKK